MDAPGEPRDVLSQWERALGRGRGRWLGILIALFCAAAMLVPDPGPLPPLRLWAFDQYQVRLPRQPSTDAVVIVAVDDQSVRRIGQWPWPRDVLARLIDRIAQRGPAVIGVDILFTEPDRSSPERIAESLKARDPELAARLARLTPNDRILAESLARARAVIGVAGTSHPIAPAAARERALVAGTLPPLPHYPGVLRSLPEIDAAGEGHGLLNADAERGIVRRVPLVALVAGDPVLTLALECLRVAMGLPSFDLTWSAAGVEAVRLGRVEVPVHSNARAWIHFSPPDPRRYVSAADVLEGTDDPRLLNKAIALVGVNALALLDQTTTARGDRMAGIEIHAQIVENVIERAFLTRPAWGRYAECALFLVLAGGLIGWVPRTRPRRSFGILAVCWLVPTLAGVAAYAFTRTLFDPTATLVALTLVHGSMLAATLVATDLHRRELGARLVAEREAAARLTGELETAQRIQTGMLPTRESALRNERRIEIFAHMQAAREVGGDLYDFFPLDDDRLLVLAGDVSDKGLPAAMFMAVTKALAKSCALRAPGTASELMMRFNTEISRENAGQLFVTLVALIMNLRTGELEYCNAGHEPPILVRRTGETFTLDEGGGPPVCVLDDFPYEEARMQLEPRDVLVLTSDGLTEAMNRAGALYGRARLKAMLEARARRELDVTVLGNEVLAAIRTFEAGAEPADDQTLLLVSWRGA